MASVVAALQRPLFSHVFLLMPAALLAPLSSRCDLRSWCLPKQVWTDAIIVSIGSVADCPEPS
jgi:hypothetical protein